MYGKLKEDIWIELPAGPSLEDKYIVKLQKSIYGLKQSPHCWNEKLDAVLQRINILKSDADDCIYVGEIKEEKIFFALYMDDGFLFCKSAKILQSFIQKLSEEFDIKSG